MFCYQCEQTAKGTGCTVQGVCGKSPVIAALQDLLLYSLMGLSQVAVEGRKVGISDNDVDVFTVKAAFSTLTNVDFDPDRFMDLIRQSTTLREKLKTQVGAAGGNIGWTDGPAVFQPKTSLDDLVKQGEQFGIKSYPSEDPDILSLKHTVLYGIKGGRKMKVFMHMYMRGWRLSKETIWGLTTGSKWCSDAVKQAIKPWSCWMLAIRTHMVTRCRQKCRWVIRREKPFLSRVMT
jgi:hydroxylamine reductase (hybrid-cluster protein)